MPAHHQPPTSRRARVVSALLLALLSGAGSAAAQAGDTLTLADRERIATGLDRGIRRHFAHWSGVPDLDYPAAYAAYRERIAGTPSRYEFDLATLEFVALLRNGHTNFRDAWLRRQHGAPLGFTLRPLGGEWVVERSRTAGLVAGDVIRRIDGEPLESFFRRKKRYIAASSERGARYSLTYLPYLFPPRFTLKLADGREVPVTRAPARSGQTASAEPVEHHWLVPDSVGYLRIPSFGEARYEERALELLAEEYAGAAALVIDVRDNGGGSTPWKLTKALMERPYSYWSESPNLSRPNLLYRLVEPIVVKMTRVPRYRGRLVILVDGGCASACEDFVMPFKHNRRATLVGDTTWGSTGQPRTLDFGDGMIARISTRRAHFPDGAPFEGVGIAPDVAVPLTAEAIRSGDDLALRRALAIARDPTP